MAADSLEKGDTGRLGYERQEQMLAKQFVELGALFWRIQLT